MSRFKIDNLPKEQRIKIIGELYDALGEIQNREQARKVFRDLFTVSEIAMMSRRIKVALLLSENYTFEEISDMVGVSKGTISRVKEKLERHGEGFNIMQQNFKKIQKRREKKYKKSGSKIDTNPYHQAEKMRKITERSIIELLNWISSKKEDSNTEKDE